MAQPMRPFHSKVYLLIQKFLICQIVNLFSCWLQRPSEFVLLLVLTSSYPCVFLILAEVAYKLGCEDLNAVTTEDMTLEVRKYNFVEDRHFAERIRNGEYCFCPI